MTQLQRLFVSSEQLAVGQVFLTPAQQHYLGRVLRLQAGDRFIVMDGQGHWWLAALTEQAAQAQILESIAAQTELPISITLLLAMPKNGLDEVVRQVTELGVSEIVLVSSQRTLLKPSTAKLDRWQRIAQEAAEQSERQTVPQVRPPQSWTEVLQAWNAANSICYLCEARGNHPHLLSCLGRREGESGRVKDEGGGGKDEQIHFTVPQKQAKSFTSDSRSPISDFRFPMTMAIGPEGGWTDAEIELAIAAGYQPVSLGARILRAVTAPMVAVAIVASVMEARL